eukprot:EG_transcript_51297
MNGIYLAGRSPDFRCGSHKCGLDGFLICPPKDSLGRKIPLQKFFPHCQQLRGDHWKFRSLILDLQSTLPWGGLQILKQRPGLAFGHVLLDGWPYNLLASIRDKELDNRALLSSFLDREQIL